MAAVPRWRDAVDRGVTMTCCRGDGVPADASPGLDVHTNHGRTRNSTQVDFPVVFWRGHLGGF